ncbi:hypothetical protein N5D16_15830 [Acinetobacter johnsonii]|uniref:hypothetical protein n=1 Tax=Acinetobacter johnsonii TaxID=40214 RepID=UPI00244ABCFB|nr:hypothetical protein [Acinetobacter johnsonii]MDH1365861.1 hypothetical protein [Acinetobacter johnsonii]MDH1520436.1 hypothetical protein [Acinetobacter johnsonii]
MINQEYESNEQLRKQIEDFIREYDSDPNVKISPDKIALLSGCCYLTKNMTRECFNNFTASQCSAAGQACGCSALFVPGGTCR